MVIDTSVILAIIYAEPEELIFIQLIDQSEDCLFSAPSYVEASIVLGTKHGQQGVEKLNLLIQALSITIIPFSAEQAELASEAFLKFGKGRHPAKLNMGDCFSYALAKSTNQPLLFKGNDFIHTDITAVFMYLNHICRRGLALLNPYCVVYLPENTCNQVNYF